MRGRAAAERSVTACHYPDVPQGAGRARVAGTVQRMERRVYGQRAAGPPLIRSNYTCLQLSCPPFPAVRGPGRCVPAMPRPGWGCLQAKKVKRRPRPDALGSLAPPPRQTQIKEAIGRQRRSAEVKVKQPGAVWHRRQAAKRSIAPAPFAMAVEELTESHNPIQNRISTPGFYI